MGRLGHAMGHGGMGGAGGSLGQILGQLGGTQSSSGGGILGSLAGMAGRGSTGGRGSMTGGLGALAASILSGRGRGTAGLAPGMSRGGGSGGMGGAIGAGGLTLLGMLAMRALQNSGQGRSQPDAAHGSDGPAPTDATPPDVAVSDATAELVLRAMIAAAKSDGRIDEAERQKITTKLQESGADQESLAYVQQEMERPLEVEGLAAEARDPVVAGQVYAASLLAIKVDTQAERDYLRDLAQRLGLQSATVSQLHQALGVPPA